MISTVKKKKVRVALRKNRQNRTRANDLTRKFRDDELTPAAEPAVDRVRPKGELSRHRTIIEEVAEENDPDARSTRIPTPPAGGPSIPRPACGPRGPGARPGLDGPCRRRSYLFLPRPPPAQDPGDRGTERRHGRRPCLVPAGSAAGSDGLIEKVEGRRGVITRGYRHRQHVIAANVDQVLIVSALAEPGLKLGLIDRYLVSAEMGGVRAVIVLNKADLVDLAALPVGDRPVRPARLRDRCHLGGGWPWLGPPAGTALSAASRP